MSPIDDELRAALHGRAQVLAPAPDPLAGIEARAKRIQRNRIGASVAGSALAVAMIAVAVPALQGATSSQPNVERFATVAPSAPATPQVAPSYSLDPKAPWAYRGEPLDRLGTGSLETIEREYAVKRRAAAATITPLYGQVDESTQQFELVFLAEVDGAYRWAVASPGEAGPEFRWDEELKQGQDALAAALPGDEVARLLVVASPEATRIEYGPRAGSALSAMAEKAPGVALRALDGDLAADTYQVTWPGDASDLVAATYPAPDPAGTPDPTGTALDPAAPWEVRGDRSLVTDGQLTALGEDWAQRHGVDPGKVTVRPLHVQKHPSAATVEVVYLVRFAQNPWMWGVSALGEGGWSWYAENELPAGATALAAALPGDEGDERLLVVAAPSMGGALYAADGRSYRPMTDVEPGVFVTAISPGDADDRFKVLDGDGDPDRPVAEDLAPDFQNAG
jgi:hypothetical protein